MILKRINEREFLAACTDADLLRGWEEYDGDTMTIAGRAILFEHDVVSELSRRGLQVVIG